MELKVGATIKKLRIEKGITQECLADFLGLSYQAISKWETNATMPDITLLPKLAVFFGVTIDDLFSINIDEHYKRIDHMLHHENMTDENFAYAKRILDEILHDDEENVDALKRYAQLYQERNNRDTLAAGRLIEKAIKINPLDEELYSLLRHIRGGINIISRSGNDWFIRFCEPFSDKYPSNKKLKYELLDSYIEMRYFDRALNMVAELKKIENSNIPDIFEGDIELARGNEEKACDIWRKAAAAGNDEKILYEAGERFNRLCRYEEAIQYFEASFAATSYPRDLSGTYSLAFLYDKLGVYEKAIEMWERILSVMSSDWNIIEGEQFDWPKREIAKLKVKM